MKNNNESKAGKSGAARVILSVSLRRPGITLLLLLAVVCSVVFAVLPPLLLGDIVDSIIAGSASLFVPALLYFAALAASGLSDAAREAMIAVYGQKITRGLREALCAKLGRLPASYFTRTEPGVTVSRFVGDVDTIETLFSSGVIGMISDCCKVAAIIIAVAGKSPGLALLILLVMPGLYFLTRAFRKRMFDAQLANRVAVGRTNAQIPETMRNIRTIHIFRREGYMTERYDKNILASYAAMEQSNFCDAIYSPIITTVSSAVIAVMMVAAASGGDLRTLFGMTVGGAVTVIAYVGKVFEPLESIGMEIQNIQSAAAGIRRIDELLCERERGETDQSITDMALTASEAPAIELENVEYSYDGSAKVLDGIGFTVGRGESVTLAGRTGAGKSTIFRLILGLYSPDAGRVRILGYDADKLPDGIKRRVFGYVEQSMRLIPGSVLDQITLRDPAVTREAAEKAAVTAGLYDTITSFGQGFDTHCSEALFSQGQLQLLAVARAVAAEPAILLLDEITANLDAETEKTLLTALKNASADRTVLSISHRLYEKSGGRIICIDR